MGRPLGVTPGGKAHRPPGLDVNSSGRPIPGAMRAPLYQVRASNGFGPGRPGAIAPQRATGCPSPRVECTRVTHRPSVPDTRSACEPASDRDTASRSPSASPPWPPWPPSHPHRGRRSAFAVERVLEQPGPAGDAARGATEWQLDNLSRIGGHPVTVVGMPRVVSTPVGRALEFNGVSDGVTVDANPIEGLSQFTIEILFEPAADGQAEQRFLHVAGDRRRQPRADRAANAGRGPVVPRHVPEARGGRAHAHRTRHRASRRRVARRRPGVRRPRHVALRGRCARGGTAPWPSSRSGRARRPLACA